MITTHCYRWRHDPQPETLPGQPKFTGVGAVILTQHRLTLTVSDSDEATIVARIFQDFVERSLSESQIAQVLHREGALSLGGIG